MTIPLKTIYRFNEVPMKIPMAFFIELEQIIIKFVWKLRGIQKPKNILRKNKAVSIMLFYLKLYYKVIAIKTRWYCYKNRYLH